MLQQGLLGLLCLHVLGQKMLGDFITRCLLLVLGYAYPALECYKTVERNRVEKEELRFWCQYWIIIALLTVVERIGDTFISWLPMYSEMKLAFVIYLWYPKTRGTGHVYEAVLRPYVGSHETDIERKLAEWRLRLWDLAIFYWQNCTELGQSAFFTVLEYLAGQPARFTSSRKKEPVYKTSQKKDHDGSGAPPEPQTVASALRRHMDKQQGDGYSKKNRKWFANAPPAPMATTYRNISETPKSHGVQVRLDSKAGYVYVEEEELMAEEPPLREVDATDISSENQQKSCINSLRGMFRRSK